MPIYHFIVRFLLASNPSERYFLRKSCSGHGTCTESGQDAMIAKRCYYHKGKINAVTVVQGDDEAKLWIMTVGG
jgi:hypothetical protein